MLSWRVLALLLIPTMFLACSSESSTPSTPNIQATIEAQVQATLEHQNQSTPIANQPQDPVSDPDPTVQVQSSKTQEPAKPNNSPSPSKTTGTSVPVNKDEAVFLYPPDSTQSLLAGLIEWPSGFDQCIKESISSQKLESFKGNSNAIGGMDKDAAAICLLSIELNSPGSTDYIKASVQSKTKPSSESANKTNPSGNKPKPKDNTGDSYSSLDKNQATALYPQDVTNDILSGILEWPSGFDQCIKESISSQKLESFKGNSNAIGGMDKDAAAICLLSIELNSPGSTDYIKASVSDHKASSSHSGTKDKPNGSASNSGNAIRSQA